MLQSVVPTLQRPVQSGNTQHINLSPGSRLPRNKSYYFLQVNFKEEEAFVSRLLLGADQYRSFKPPQTRLSPAVKPSPEVPFAPSDAGQPFFQPCFTTPLPSERDPGPAHSVFQPAPHPRSQLVRRAGCHGSGDRCHFPGWASREGDISVTQGSPSQSQLHVQLIHNAAGLLTAFPCCFRYRMSRKITDH